MSPPAHCRLSCAYSAACTPGTYSLAGAANCTVCPAGSSSSAAASTCLCNKGYALSGSGASLTCIACVGGTYSPAGAPCISTWRLDGENTKQWRGLAMWPVTHSEIRCVCVPHMRLQTAWPTRSAATLPLSARRARPSAAAPREAPPARAPPATLAQPAPPPPPPVLVRGLNAGRGRARGRARGRTRGRARGRARVGERARVGGRAGGRVRGRACGRAGLLVGAAANRSFVPSPRALSFVPFPLRALSRFPFPICSLPRPRFRAPSLSVRTLSACGNNTYSLAGSSSCTACPSGSASGAAAAICLCLPGYALSGATAQTLTCTGNAWRPAHLRLKPRLTCLRLLAAAACAAGSFSASGASCAST